MADLLVPRGPNDPLPMRYKDMGDGSIAQVVAVAEEEATSYQTVAASQTAVLLGATGAVGDMLQNILVVPASTSPGAITITDGNGSAITVFAGGATSLSNLAPFRIPLGIRAKVATTPGWRITTGASLSVIVSGRFT